MSSDPANDDEKGVVVAVDEVELARMGYKQELKFVHLSGWLAMSCPDTFAIFADESLVFCRYLHQL
jgi:hypothetical protein